MATIADNLNTLQVIKLDIKNAINSKGGSANDDFRTYANAIEELPSGGGDDTLVKLMNNELTTFNIPNDVTNIKDYFFASATTLINITIPNTVTRIGNYAFQSCTGLTSIEIPDSVTSIGSSAFLYCSGLTSATIGNSVTRISASAFGNCSGLTSIEIPDSVTIIEGAVFAGCSGLTSATIANSVTSIGNNAFQYTKKLANIYCNWLIPPTNGSWFSNAYTGGTLHVPNGSSEYYQSKWTGTNALFSSTFHWNIVEDMGDYTPSNVLIAKYNVTATTATRIFGGNNKFASGATSASTGCTIWIEETPSMFSGSGYTFASVGEKEIRIDFCPNALPTSAFTSATTLTEAIIPNNVTTIGGNAFSSCSGLTNVTIPNSVTNFGSSAFNSCKSLTSINYNGTKEQFTSITKGVAWKNYVPTSCIVHCTDGDYPISDFS